jgi:hypothetical protein
VDQAVEGLPSPVKEGEPLVIDNTGHPANACLALAKSSRSHLHVFGLGWDDVRGGNNGHFAIEPRPVMSQCCDSLYKGWSFLFPSTFVVNGINGIRKLALEVAGNRLHGRSKTNVFARGTSLDRLFWDENFYLVGPAESRFDSPCRLAARVFGQHLYDVVLIDHL